jgi:hypothetical protein
VLDRDDEAGLQSTPGVALPDFWSAVADTKGRHCSRIRDVEALRSIFEDRNRRTSCCFTPPRSSFLPMLGTRVHPDGRGETGNVLGTLSALRAARSVWRGGVRQLSTERGQPTSVCSGAQACGGGETAAWAAGDRAYLSVRFGSVIPEKPRLSSRPSTALIRGGWTLASPTSPRLLR